MNFLINATIFGLVIGLCAFVIRSNIQRYKKCKSTGVNDDDYARENTPVGTISAAESMPKNELNQNADPACYDPFNYANPNNAWLYTSANPNSPLSH